MRHNEMKKSFSLQIWSAALGMIAMVASNARAQLPGPNVPSQTPAAKQLPLSGRSGQNGSVTGRKRPFPAQPAASIR